MEATENQAQEAISRIDHVLDERRIEPALTRKEHIQLAQDLRVIQERVKLSYVIEAEALEQLTAKKDGIDGRTND